MVVADLRRGSRMAVVLIPVCEVVRLCRSCGIHLLHLGKRFAHASEGHRHLIRCTLCLAACRYQTVQFVIGIGMAEGTAQLGLAASLRRVYGIGDAFASYGRHAVSCWQQKQWGTFRVNRNLYLALHVSIKLIITFTDRRLLRALPKYALPCVVLPAIRSRIILPCSIFVGTKIMIFK